MHRLATLGVDVDWLGVDARGCPVVQVTDARGIQPPYSIRADGCGRDVLGTPTRLDLSDTEVEAASPYVLQTLCLFPARNLGGHS